MYWLCESIAGDGKKKEESEDEDQEEETFEPLLGRSTAVREGAAAGGAVPTLTRRMCIYIYIYICI